MSTEARRLATHQRTLAVEAWTPIRKVGAPAFEVEPIVFKVRTQTVDSLNGAQSDPEGESSLGVRGGFPSRWKAALGHKL